MKYASQLQIARNSLKTANLWISRSIKVIDNANPEKLVSTVSYDKQKICVYLEPFFTASCYSNGAVLPSYDVRLSVCP